MEARKMRKLWKMGIALSFLSTMSVPRLHEFIPTLLWAVLINAALTYLISLLYSYDLPTQRRLSVAFLTLIGITYFVPAAFGFDQSMGFVEGDLWNHLISPYLLVSVYEARHLQPNVLPSHRAYYFVPQDGHHLFSGIALMVSVAAICGAVLMAKGKRAGTWIWTSLLGISMISLAGYVYVGVVARGIKEISVQLLWEASYIVAFLLARSGAGVQISRVLSQVEER
jgi:hypothetical protein